MLSLTFNQDVTKPELIIGEATSCVLGIRDAIPKKTYILSGGDAPLPCPLRTFYFWGEKIKNAWNVMKRKNMQRNVYRFL